MQGDLKMIKESYIKNKVTSILGKLAYREQSKRLESDRAAARIANIISQEVDRATEEYKRYITKLIHATIKKELS